MKFALLTLIILFISLIAVEAQDKDPSTPKLINSPKVVFPTDGVELDLGGGITIYFKVGKDGKVNVLGAVGPLAPCSKLDDPRIKALRQAAVDAFKTALFEPPLKDGKPTEMELSMTVKVPSHGPTLDQGPKIVNAGVLNGKALSLPKPEYPRAAHSERAGGTVSVQVLIDETGKVLGAAAISGHPLLRESSEIAACGAKFSPIRLQGNLIKVNGVITYNYIP